MKIFHLLGLAVAFSLFTTAAFAQKQAVTDEGEIVILHDDGTWEYQEVTEELPTAIATNPKKFEKSVNAKFLLKSKVNDSGFYLDTKKWEHHGAENNSDAEYEFKLKGGDLYAMAITERISIPLTVLKNAVLTNARAASPNVKLVNEEFRIVNGQTILQLEMQGVIDGIDFTYFGYYMSTPAGSTQFMVYTSTNLMNEYRSEIETLLNGLVKQ